MSVQLNILLVIQPSQIHLINLAEKDTLHRRRRVNGECADCFSLTSPIKLQSLCALQVVVTNRKFKTLC